MGNVDFSCSFTVTDPKLPGNPIVYASETFFERFWENCRFLQSPTGQVEAGSVRKYSDSNVAFQMKDSIRKCKECQFSIINYKKSGEPFINLVTIIPIFYENSTEPEYFVGFQVDLVEQPQAILNRCKEGSYMVDYKIADDLSRSSKSARSTPQGDSTSPFSLDSYSQPYFVHILSLRARFLYASPVAAKRILEYSSGGELLGRELHEFVHPADLVSVMRELRTSRPGDNINFICRFKRKFSGYIYLEVNGHIYEGSNVNKKCFVFSGRELSVSVLPGVPLSPTTLKYGSKSPPKDSSSILPAAPTPSSATIAQIFLASPSLIFSTLTIVPPLLDSLNTFPKPPHLVKSLVAFYQKQPWRFLIQMFPDKGSTTTVSTVPSGHATVHILPLAACRAGNTVAGDTWISTLICLM
ncbi:hypothetical protein BC829DRAFT_398345 [Chytridium lagenaria]|nr:hypothetical protein BC829DRAFT_398345 [Chytridium lagenaria]